MVKKIGQRKFLLKRGYFESELDKMSPSEAKRIIASIEKIEHPQGQRKVYSEKEINAIKEFVEWLKKRLDEQCTHLKNSDEFDLERSIGIHIVLANLDKHLEKFLEEKK